MDPHQVTWTEFLTTFFDDQNRFGVYYADSVVITNPDSNDREIRVDGAAVILSHSILDVLQFLEKLNVSDDLQAAVLRELGSRPEFGTLVLDTDAITAITELVILGIYEIEKEES